jgi:hypothetical protein|tara:strand:+ start:2726 stop:4555 length:1830 start_codon:yes stop_codon:yes gene_type:complete
MAYQINKTSGALLVNLADGQIDINSTDITLIGKNYSGFGEAINENFVKMLENFANSSAPAQPLAGQIWWDTTNQRLQVYTGTAWTTGGGPIVSASRPVMVAGDLWIDNNSNQMYFYDGTDLTLAGPIYNAFQGKSGPETVTVLDDTGTSRNIVKYWIGGSLVGLWSKISFTPQNIDTIPNFSGNVVKGFNVVDADFVFAGTATRTESLVDSSGVIRTAGQFLASDSDDSTSGALSVRNNNGITIGLTDNNQIKVTNLGVVSENNVSGENYIIRMTTSLGKKDAVTIDSANSRVGIYNSSPSATLDVTGDMKVSGNFTVEGTQTILDVQTLRVRDKQIQLARGDDSTLLDNPGVNDSGITVESSGGNKEWLWKNSTNSWTSNVNINLTGGAKLQSDGIDLIDGTTAPGITAIGNLTSANIGNMSFSGITISTGVASGTNGLILTLAGDISLGTARKIRNVQDPVLDQDVATKAYVDSSIDLEVIPLSLDITGLGTGSTLNTNIATIINDIAPANTKRDGTEARIHCTSTVGAVATLSAANLNASFNKSLTTVQKLDNSGADDGSASVIGDATFNDVTGAITSTVARTLKLFRVNGGSWGYVQDLTPGNLV